MLIDEIYCKIAENVPDFISRSSQKKMIAEIDRVFSSSSEKHVDSETNGNNLLLIEAPTGTGKSLAYILAGMVNAKKYGKKLIISTATKTLQNQLINKDIPDFIKNSGFKFTYGIAKGRSNFVCPHQIESNRSDDKLFHDQDDIFEPNSSRHIDKLNELSFQLEKNFWNGDIDTAPINIDSKLKKLITISRHQCLGNSCPYNQKDDSVCPYYTNRSTLKKVDVIVVNHSLLLADLELGGGVLLPCKPSDYFLCVDEAHNLSNYAIDSFMGSFELKHSISNCDALAKFAYNPSNLSYASGDNIDLCNKIADKARELSECLDEFYMLLKHNLQLFDTNQQLILNDYLNPAITTEFNDAFIKFAYNSVELIADINKLQNKFKEILKDKADFNIEAKLIKLGIFVDSVTQIVNNSSYLISKDNSRYNANARWIEIKNIRDSDDFVIFAGVTHAGGILANKLWDKIHAAVLTSATLSIGSDFSYYKHELGLHLYPNISVHKLSSSFDYSKQAQIVVPKFKYSPEYKTRNEFSREFTQYLIKELDYNDPYGTLVLFFNRAQMQDVFDNLPRHIQQLVLMQSDFSNSTRLISRHKKHIDNGEPSIIFGLTSFSEGVDLPSIYCMNVIISKLPFDTHTDPLNLVREFWVKYEKGNYFMDIGMPEACIKLIQAVGRLIRSELDYGQVTICDNRLINKPYGLLMLNALPDFNRVYNKDFMVQSFMKMRQK